MSFVDSMGVMGVQPIGSGLRKTQTIGDVRCVAADGPAQQRQRLQERCDPGLKLRIVRGCVQDYADAPHPLRLLRARRERPRGSAAE
jgi:hypothetical protein